MTTAAMPVMIPEDSGYLAHLGLNRNPFPVVPDETCIFLSGRIEQIVAEIVHGVAARKGFMLLTGDVGLGKTTISRRVISILEQKGIETALVLHTSLQDAELLREINRDFGIPNNQEKDRYDSKNTSSLGEQLRQLNQFLVERNHQNKNCAIIIDDAQNLNRRSLELVRMISNLEGERQKLVQIILIGQPELAEQLQTHELRQLRSRVVISAEVTPLSRKELKAYIDFKLSLAGNHGQTSVTPWAVSQIYRYTHGNFRLVNMLMDRCLYVICLQNRREITLGVVKLAQKDLFPAARPKLTRRLAAAAIVLLLSAAGWAVVEDKGPLVQVGSMLDRITLKSAEPADSVAKNSPERQSPAFDKPSDNAADAVLSFFQPLGLAHYAEQFRSAQANATLDLFARELFNQSGYQLIGLDHLSSATRQNFGVLSMPQVNGDKRYYVLWRPPVEIKNFYYTYQGPEINYLQSLLTKANLYHDRLDHIVGPRLMQAVVVFQKIHGLPVTGFPDPKTLFLLCHS